MSQFPRDDINPFRRVAGRLPAGTHNALIAAARKLRARVAQPLRAFQSGAGTVLSADFDPDALWVRLSGSLPYSWVEQEWVAGAHAFGDRPGGRTGTSNAYEVDGLTGLGANPFGHPGKIVKIYPGAGPGDWVFRFHRVGVPCTAQLIVEVLGCSGPMVGAVVTVKDSGGTIVPYSSTSDTCTIGRTSGPCGVAVWCAWTNVTEGATYTVHVDPPPHYIAPGTDQTVTLACGINVARFECSGGLTDPNYLCVESDHACCLFCPTPLPRSLSLDDGVGTIPLTFTGYQSAPLKFCAMWEGDVSRVPSCDVYTPGFDPYGNPTCILVIPTPAVNLHFRFYCCQTGEGSGGPARVYYGGDVTYQFCYSDGVCHLADGGLTTTLGGSVLLCVDGVEQPSLPAYTCDPPYFPFNLSFNPVCQLGLGGPILAFDKAICFGYAPGTPWTVTG